MKIRNNYFKKIVIFLSAVFYISTTVGVAQAQQKLPTQKDLDALNALAGKMPTSEQGAELTRITDEYQKKYEPLNSEIDKLGREIERLLQDSGVPLTKTHVQAAIVNHKKLRSFYVENLNAIGGWGRQVGRLDCVRQAEKTRDYALRVSDQWLVKVAALPLSTVEERLYAAQYVGTGGGGMTFQPDPEPVLDPRFTVGFELVGLIGVCNGLKGEYIPGTE